MRRLWRRFKSLFVTKKEEEQPRTYEDHIDDIIVSTIETDKRIAIIVGHTDSARGANTYKIPLYNRRVSEYEWNGERAKEIKFHIQQMTSKVAVKIIKRDGIGISGAYKKAGTWGATHTVELHLNSMGHDKDFFGAEILTYKGETRSAKVAEDFLKEFCTLFNYTNRGVKVKSKNQRGGSSVYYSKKCGAEVGLLLEPTFVGTRTSESARLLEGSGPDDYSSFIAKFLVNL